MITFDDFKKLELRTAKIVDVKDHPDADRLYIVDVEIAQEKRQVVAGIKSSYQPEDLIGKSVVVVVNLEPATIRGVESNGMILAASDDNGLSVITLDKDVLSGSLVK